LVVKPLSSGEVASALAVVEVGSLEKPPKFVMSNVEIVGLAFGAHPVLDSAGLISAGEPDTVYFTTKRRAGGDRIYALDLSAASTLTPRQVSGFSIDGSKEEICSAQLVQQALTDTRHGFLLLAIGSGCAYGSTHFARVPLSDDIQALPLSTSWSYVLPLYQPSGSLGGVVATDPSGVSFYKQGDPAQPTMLIQGTGFQSQQPLTNDVAAIARTPGYAFIETMTFDGNWYRVDASGTISGLLHTTRAPDTTAPVNVLFDSSDMYLLDNDANSIYHLSKFANDGHSPATDIYSGGSFFEYPSLGLAGQTDGSVLLFALDGESPALDGIPACPCSIVDVLKSGAQAATIPSLASFVGSFSVWPTASSTEYLLQTTNGYYSTMNATTILDKHGPVLQPSIAQSSFLGSVGSALLELRSASDPLGISNAQIHQLLLSGGTLVDTVLTLPSGSGYTSPSVTQAPGLVPLNDGMAVVCFSTMVGSTASSAVAIVDTSRKQIAPVDVPNSAVSLLLPYRSRGQCPALY
jgi:hypothetical protein